MRGPQYKEYQPHINGKRTQISGICSKHGYYKGQYCPVCIKEQHYPDVPNINTGEWVKGYYEHIDTDPIYIESKQHLIQECKKRGLYAKAFLKHKSQGKGLEHRR